MAILIIRSFAASKLSATVGSLGLFHMAKRHRGRFRAFRGQLAPATGLLKGLPARIGVARKDRRGEWPSAASHARAVLSHRAARGWRRLKKRPPMHRGSCLARQRHAGGVWNQSAKSWPTPNANRDRLTPIGVDLRRSASIRPPNVARSWPWFVATPPADLGPIARTGLRAIAAPGSMLLCPRQ